MSIDSSALTAINNAISSSSYKDYLKKNTASKTSDNENDLNTAQGIAKLASEVTYTSRYQAAFQEKLNKANSSEDDVTISEESLAKLEAYNKTGKSSSSSSSTEDTASDKTQNQSNSTVYGYDYMTLKKQREANMAAIEKDVASKYSKATDEAVNTQS